MQTDAEFISEIRANVQSALASRERAGITYRSCQMYADDIIRLCDAAERGI